MNALKLRPSNRVISNLTDITDRVHSRPDARPGNILATRLSNYLWNGVFRSVEDWSCGI